MKSWTQRLTDANVLNPNRVDLVTIFRLYTLHKIFDYVKSKYHLKNYENRNEQKCNSGSKKSLLSLPPMPEKRKHIMPHAQAAD